MKTRSYTEHLSNGVRMETVISYADNGHREVYLAVYQHKKKLFKKTIKNRSLEFAQEVAHKRNAIAYSLGAARTTYNGDGGLT